MGDTCGERSRRPGGDTYPSPFICLVSSMRSVAIHRLNVQRIIGSWRLRHGPTRLAPSQRRHTTVPIDPHLANTSLCRVNAYAPLRLKPRAPPASPKTWFDASRRTAQPVRSRHGSSRRTQPESTAPSRLAGYVALFRTDSSQLNDASSHPSVARICVNSSVGTSTTLAYGSDEPHSCARTSSTCSSSA